MQKFDLIVIGSGPAGQRAAIQAAKCGKHVVVVEQREIVGGTCINTGTIPSKTMREAVLHLSGFQYQGIYGVNYRVKDKITMADLNFRASQVIKTEVDVTQAQLSRNGVSVIMAKASFLDATHVRIENSRGQADLEAPLILIATGTKPAVSPLVPLNGRNIINSDQILSIPEIPKTFIVVGGGVIGVEYACMFAILGSRVILVEKRPRLLEFADNEMVEALSYHLRDHRVTMRTQRRGGQRGGDCRRRRGGEPEKQQAHLGRCAALRSGPARQCGRTQPGGGGPGSGQSRAASPWTPNSARRYRASSRPAT